MSNHCYYTIDNVRKTRVYNPIHAAWQALFPSFPFGRVIDFMAPLCPITWITTSFIDCNIVHGDAVGKKNISTLYDRFSISYVDREFKTGVFRRERIPRSRIKIFETAYRSLTIVWIERKKLLNFCQRGERGDSFAIFLNEETVGLPSNYGAKCFRYNEDRFMSRNWRRWNGADEIFIPLLGSKSGSFPVRW